MKVFCYFVEPASYTIDLVKNVHVKHNIDYCFINEKSTAETTDSINVVYLSQLSFLAKFWFVFNIWKSYDLVIINGYNNYPFILTFLFNLYSGNKKYIY